MKLKFEPEKREPKTLTKIILALPAILSASWIAFMGLQNKVIPVEEGVYLSPPMETNMLVTALSIFTIGYVVFLLLMFSEDIKEFIVKHRKLSPK
ncbi:MAG: hypothetical protein ABIJ08_06100 [Nanoarchaeota archaeon]